ncbi:MAG: hypothetical protein ACK4FB_09010 [Brevundimonas sp.]|uniref:hypothetical protein n=1 Tax=Brevundimonas sp. TaxID=1871086 RepID=UPI00391B40E6
MSDAAIAICNLSIDRIAGDAIESFTEETPLGAFCARNFPDLQRDLLSKYRWTFANQIARLAEVAPDPAEAAPMAHRFARPGDLTGAVHAWRDHADPAQGRRVHVLDVGRHFWADTRVVFAEYTRMVAPEHWPSWFKTLFQTALAARLADFAQQRTLANRLTSEAFGTPQDNGEGGLYQQARNEDARLAPPRQLTTGVDAGPLVGVRERHGFAYDPSWVVIGGA